MSPLAAADQGISCTSFLSSQKSSFHVIPSDLCYGAELVQARLPKTQHTLSEDKTGLHNRLLFAVGAIFSMQLLSQELPKYSGNHSTPLARKNLWAVPAVPGSPEVWQTH